MARARFRGLLEHLAEVRPDLDDAYAAVMEGRVLVDGTMISNPRARVRVDASIIVHSDNVLRGEIKLRAAFDAFPVDAIGRVALDAGASTGGFTRTLVNAGATRVYAVDAGHGQLLGSLRQDPRVVNLENTNLGDLTRQLVPQAVEIITLDLSYLAIGAAVPQLEVLDIAPDADLIALVKPMFELGLEAPPTDRSRLQGAVARAVQRVEEGPWEVLGRIASPVRGARGAIEFFIHARRALR
jgi:23S rRNA (cytidine1920-2'-O)/16S rRNA (cytidine1409-2'-O)-methyltransferase